MDVLSPMLFVPPPDPLLARGLAIRLEVRGLRFSDGQDFERVGPEGVPEMLRLLPRVRRSFVAGQLGQRLRELGVVESIRPLIATFALADDDFDRSPSRLFDPQHWGWRAIGPMLDGMKSPRPKVRAGCAWGLMAYCAPSDFRLLPAMLRGMKDETPLVRRAALKSLWSFRLRSDEAARAVVGAAFDRDPEVRREAMEGLADACGMTSESRFLAPDASFADDLERLGRPTDPFRRAAAVALDLSVPGTKGSLARLRDSDPTVRFAQRLGEVRGWRALAPPMGRLTLPRLVASLAEPLGPAVGEHPALTELRRRGWRSVPGLVAGARSPSREVRRGCAELLSEWAVKSSHGTRLRSALLRLSHDEDEVVRIASIDGLATLALGASDRAAMGALVDLAFDPSWLVFKPARQRFAAELFPEPGPGAYTTDDGVRLPADSAPTLLRLLQTGTPVVRAATVALLFALRERLDYPEGITGAQALGDADPLVRHAARAGLRGSWRDLKAGEDDQKFAFMLSLLHDGRPRVRIDAAGALSEAMRPSAILDLTPLLRDPDLGVRAASGHAIRVLRGDDLLPRR